MSTTSDTQRVQCTGCKTGFKLKKQHIGKTVKCPKCQTTFTAIAIDARPSASPPLQPVAQPGFAANQAPVAPPGTKRCDMCHKFIPIQQYAAHRKSHDGVREDGQHNEYPTLPPEEQYRGSLDNVPKWYVHDQCGQTTGMPEEIIRTYLVNPYFYGYSSYCGGCQTHVSAKELKWTETGEYLMDYTRRLQAGNPNSKKYRNQFLVTLIGTSVFGGVVLGLLAGGISFFFSSLLIAMVVFIMVAVMGTLAAMGVLVSMRGGI